MTLDDRQSQPQRTLLLQLTTFGHRNGPLVEPAPDLLFDLRDIPNPPKELRTAARQTGQITSIQEWLFSLASVQQRFHEIRKQILQHLGEAETAGAERVDVGLGCNLGRNRSVTIAETLASLDWGGWCVAVQHRDLGIHHAGKDVSQPIIPSRRNEVAALLAHTTTDVPI